MGIATMNATAAATAAIQPVESERRFFSSAFSWRAAARDVTSGAEVAAAMAAAIEAERRSGDAGGGSSATI